jgi:hypothetical protein
MKFPITIKDQEVNMIFGYRTLKKITELTQGAGGDLSMESIELALFDALQFGIKCESKELKVTKQDLVDLFELDYDVAVEAQAALEVFMRGHSKKRVDSLVKLGISKAEAQDLPQ